MSPLANKLFSLLLVFLYVEVTSSVLTKYLKLCFDYIVRVCAVFFHPSINSNDPITDNLFSLSTYFLFELLLFLITLLHTDISSHLCVPINFLIHQSTPLFFSFVKGVKEFILIIIYQEYLPIIFYGLI